MSAIETEYVSQKIFDLQLDNLKNRSDLERERVDDRLEKNQAIADKNMAEVKAMFAEIRAEINEVRGDVKELRSEVRGLEKRFDDMKEYQNKWFTVFGILFAAAIVAPVATAVVQHFMTR